MSMAEVRDSGSLGAQTAASLFTLSKEMNLQGLKRTATFVQVVRVFMMVQLLQKKKHRRDTGNVVS